MSAYSRRWCPLCESLVDDSHVCGACGSKPWADDLRWCPLCFTLTREDVWSCPECGAQMWTHGLLWEELQRAVRLRPYKRGTRLAEAGRLLIDLSRRHGTIMALKRQVKLERERTAAASSESESLREAVCKVIGWLEELSRGSSPRKSVDLATLRAWSKELRIVAQRKG